jgi:hypothetical protein
MMSEDQRTDFEDGVVYGFEMALNAFQETLPAPHNDRSELSREIIELDGRIFDVVREVAAGRLTLVETSVGYDVEGFPQELVSRAIGRQREVAEMILRCILAEEVE